MNGPIKVEWFAGVQLDRLDAGASVYHPHGYCPSEVRCDACACYPAQRAQVSPVERLLDLLGEYGGHQRDCEAEYSQACDCGWSQAQHELEQIETRIPEPQGESQ